MKKTLPSTCPTMWHFGTCRGMPAYRALNRIISNTFEDITRYFDKKLTNDSAKLCHMWTKLTDTFATYVKLLANVRQVVQGVEIVVQGQTPK